MAFVPIAALAALAGTTTALYQSAQLERKGNSRVYPNLPTTTNKPLPTPTVKSQDYSGNIQMTTSTKPTRTKKKINTRKTAMLTSRVVKAPVSAGVIYRNPSRPMFRSSQNGGAFVSNTEVVDTVTMAAGGLFAGFTDALIPSLPSWLAVLSDCYSKFRWVKLKLIYIPSCPTTTAGRVGMTLGYDRNDAAYGTITQITQGYHAIVFPPYAGFEGCQILNEVDSTSGAICLDVDVTRFDKPWYPTISNTAFSALPANIQNQYAPASLQVGSDQGVAVTAGNIYWKYTCEFIEPVNPTVNV